MEKESGVATITSSDDWEKAALHLWGVTLADLARLFHSTLLTPAAKPVEATLRQESVEIGEHIRRIVIKPPIQQVSVTF